MEASKNGLAASRDFSCSPTAPRIVLDGLLRFSITGEVIRAQHPERRLHTLALRHLDPGLGPAGREPVKVRRVCSFAEVKSQRP